MIEPATVKALVKAIAEDSSPIRGRVALALARLLHEARLDSSDQWGCLYFRCPECDQARDCGEADEFVEEYLLSGRLGCDSCSECEGALRVDDLRISEGWVERVCISREGGKG